MNNMEDLIKEKYEHSELKYQSDDIERRIVEKIERSNKEQRKANRILIAIGLLTLFFTALGTLETMLQFVK